MCFTLRYTFSIIIILLVGCSPSPKTVEMNNQQETNDPHIIVLGIAQDAGYPQADCKKSCCKNIWDKHSKRKMVSCLGLKIPKSNEVYLFDATPDFKDQLQKLKGKKAYNLGGVFLTHAHTGHYTGLINLGREAMGANSVPVYAMSRMQEFLSTNGPWDQLVKLKNISFRELESEQNVMLSENIGVKPILVPHRDEYSETVGFIISGPIKKVLFIPDIDKWHLWKFDIKEQIKEVDFAFLDGTFYQNGEIRGRDMSQIPHPFVEESMRLFKDLPEDEKSKVHFIHLNHTNPLLRNGEEYNEVLKQGFQIAKEGMVIRI